MKGHFTKTCLLTIIVAVIIGILINIFVLYKVSTVETTYVKFQDRMSMDWDSVDSQYLLWIAQEKGGDVEERAYTILVTLNRVVALGYPIPTMVKLELNEDLPEDFKVDYQSMEALHMITHDRFDNSNGSMRYRN